MHFHDVVVVSAYHKGIVKKSHYISQSKIIILFLKGWKSEFKNYFDC